MKRRDFKELIKIKPVIYLAVLLAALFVKLGCSSLSFSTPGLDKEVGAGAPPISTGEYGKFVIYKVGDGKIQTLGMPDSNSKYYHNKIFYHITDFNYLPSTEPTEAGQRIYNIDHCGDGYIGSTNALDTGQSIFYKDDTSACGLNIPRRSSDHPEALVVDHQLQLYYTNYPRYGDTRTNPSTGMEYLACASRPSLPGPSIFRVCDGGLPFCTTIPDFSDTPDLAVTGSIMGGFNCQMSMSLSAPASHGDTPDVDWIYIPFGTDNMGHNHFMPLKIRLIGDELNINGLRIVKMTLYQVAKGGLPVDSDSVTHNRFGLDYYRDRDPVLGYVLNTNNDYWLKVSDWSAQNGPAPALDYHFFLFFEATPTEPLPWDVTSAIYKATVLPSQSGNSSLNDGAHFTPDDPNTPVQSTLPDCAGKKGDWGVYGICPEEGQNVISGDTSGVQDGVMEWWELDNKANMDDGNLFTGTQIRTGITSGNTILSSMGYEAPSVIEVGDTLWMFVATGSGIFQLSSLDGHQGLQWDLKYIYNNQPSLLPRSLDPNAPGDPEAPVVTSGRYGFCDTDAQPDDIQVTPKGKGYANSVCITFGEDGVMNSYPMEDDSANGVINSGPDGVINTFIFPKCVAALPPVYAGQEQLTEAPGNPDLACGDSVPGSDDYSAFLMGDDEWATSEIGLNPPEYWRRQHCNLFSMADNFDRCALGKSNTWMATGGGGVPHTVQDRLYGNDYFCQSGSMAAICPGAGGKFDEPGVEDILNILRKVPNTSNGDHLCDITPAGGLEYARFKYSNHYQLEHANIIPGSVRVVSFLLNLFGSPAAVLTEGPAGDYQIDYVNGTISWSGNNWLNPLVPSLGPLDPAKNDVLIVYYRYQGSQIGICPGGGTSPTLNFYATYVLPDRILGGPPIELPPALAAALGKDYLYLPGLADTYVGTETGETVQWQQNTYGKFGGGYLFGTFACSGGACRVSPGSDNTLDAAWFLDADATSYNGDYPSTLFMVKPHRYDLWGQFDDWFCLTSDGQMALCPGGNGYFQVYRLLHKEEMKRYKGVDDVLLNFKDPNDPCYSLEVTQERSHFYANDESVYVLYAYQGLMGDDRISWDAGSGKYVLTTGTNGINQSCISQKDTQIIPRYKGQPYQSIINGGADLTLETPALKDERQFIDIEGEKPLPKILSGEDGICNSYRIGDDRTEIFMGTGVPDYPCVKAGPNGIADTQAQGNDSQIYLPGEKTGFDSYAVETPEVVKDGDKLYLFYTGLGWMNIPRQVPPGRSALAKNGECKRPGLDQVWGNIDTVFDPANPTGDPDPPGTPSSQERTLVINKLTKNPAFAHALDDNQGVLLAPRIGVATSTIERINADPSDWTRVLKPAIDVGGICSAALSGVLGSFSLGGLSISGGLSLPPIFNYFGSFSPAVIIKHTKGDDKPTFIMWLTGAFATRNQMAYESSDEFSGILQPQFQIGLARSVDGINFDLANDLNPLIVTGDIMADVQSALLGGGDKYSYLNPTVFKGTEDDTYGMIFKMSLPQKVEGHDVNIDSLDFISQREWLAFGVRNGFVYSGGLLGLISCAVNPQHLMHADTAYQTCASLILLLPVAALIVLRLRMKKNRTR